MKKIIKTQGHGEKNYSLEEVLRAVEGSGAIMSVVATRLGCEWQTAKKYVLKYPEAVKLFESEELKGVDFAESKLLELVRNGDLNAIALYLKHKGRRRGWGTETESMNWKGVLKSKEG